MQSHTIGALVLKPMGNAQGSFYFLSLSTRCVRQKNDPGLLFLDRNQQQYDDQVDEEGNEDSEYDPIDDESIESGMDDNEDDESTNVKEDDPGANEDDESHAEEDAVALLTDHDLVKNPGVNEPDDAAELHP